MGNASVSVPSRFEALIRAKRAAGRRKDLDHSIELEAIAATIAAERPR